MSCIEHEERLSAYIDRELPRGELSALEEHLAACESCSAALETMKAQASDLEAAFAPLRARAEAAVPAVLAALEARAPAMEAPPPSAPVAPISRPRWPLLVSFVSAAAGFLLAFMIFAAGPVAPIIPKGPVALLPQAPPPSPAPAPPAPPSHEKPLTPVVATLAAATGALEIKGGEDWRPLASGGAIADGSWVRTVGRAKASFECSDGSEVRLNASTEIQLASRTVVLKKGEIYTRVAHDPEKRFSVSTDAGRIEAIGTTLDVAHSEATRLTVIEGKALVGETTIEQGYSCSIANGVPSNPTPAQKLEILASWVEEIVAIHGAGTEDFQKEIDRILEDIGQSKAERMPEEEIRAMGDHCAIPLARYIFSERSRARGEARRRAARILADMAPKASIGDLARLLDDDDSQVRLSAARGIERITGDNRGYTKATWTGDGYREAAAQWRAYLGNPRGPWCEDPKR